MNQFKLNLYWLLNKLFLRRGLDLFGIGCSETKEVQTITTSRCVWERPTGTRAWSEMKSLAGNLRTG